MAENPTIPPTTEQILDELRRQLVENGGVTGHKTETEQLNYANPLQIAQAIKALQDLPDAPSVVRRAPKRTTFLRFRRFR